MAKKLWLNITGLGALPLKCPTKKGVTMFLLHQLFGNDTPDNKSIFENNKPEYPVRFELDRMEKENEELVRKYLEIEKQIGQDSRFELLFHQNEALYEMLTALLEKVTQNDSPIDYDFSHYKPLFFTQKK
jgi:hypothetical protein